MKLIEKSISRLKDFCSKNHCQTVSENVEGHKSHA